MHLEFGAGPRRSHRGSWFAPPLILLIAALALFLACGGNQDLAQPPIAESDDPFLNDLSHAAFTYFWEQADPGTGLVRDRAHADGTSVGVASIAATGFGLTAMCIGAQRQWVTTEQARERVRTTLRFFTHRAFQEHGWFYH